MHRNWNLIIADYLAFCLSNQQVNLQYENKRLNKREFKSFALIVESNRYGSAESVIRMSIKDLKRFAGAIVTLLPAIYVWLVNA